jgi:hypothetical protein
MSNNIRLVIAQMLLLGIVALRVASKLWLYNFSWSQLPLHTWICIAFKIAFFAVMTVIVVFALLNGKKRSR